MEVVKLNWRKYDYALEIRASEGSVLLRFMNLNLTYGIMREHGVQNINSISVLNNLLNIIILGVIIAFDEALGKTLVNWPAYCSTIQSSVATTLMKE